MQIYFEEKTGTFHLTNSFYSYIIKILPNQQLGQLYFGKPVRHKESFDYLLEMASRSMSPCVFEGNGFFSLEQVKQEFPSYGTGDYRHPAVRIQQSNGSAITEFAYTGYEITSGKPALEGLPATYCEDDKEAMTLHVFLKDQLTGVKAELLYTVFEAVPALARSVRYTNEGEQAVLLDTAMSMNLDLPDSDYEFVQFSGAWARERFEHVNHLRPGIQSVESLRGHSSHHHNPFIILKRPDAGEQTGEALGFSLVYSGNFLAQAEVDNWGVTRVSMGINPYNFSWQLKSGDSFQTPEAVVVYSDRGLNHMSQSFHKLYAKRLARGVWRDKARPILINNWEATYFDFTEDKLVGIASQAKDLGVEMFVLDDGWFGQRVNDKAGLGDWVANPDRLANGITGLAERIDQMGMLFGLWFEPEMVNKDSDLYRAHPDWAIQTPGRNMTHGRNQYVLDFSRKEVVDYIYDAMAAILGNAKVSYVKWDMNRSITEAFSAVLPAEQQGEVMHRYILGLYDLYERLTQAFPHVLFESCASGGARFDPGLLYYAPQAWTSDCTDAVQRLKIQHGSSFCYPISSMGAHVSMSPNHQLFRSTPLKTRGNVACFGTFGYEMDLQLLSDEEKQEVVEQIKFMKEYRELLQFGTFYRLLSPFEGNFTSWMVVSEDKKTAIVGYYKVLNEVNGPFTRVFLAGLDPELDYQINGSAVQGGDELMNIGLITTDSSAGECKDKNLQSCDFDSRLYVLKAK
ncbi:MAG: alpha-galactosidase [Lachnospiraceae bacterium]|nr:alpha-galactosidase [Lachnospiraceae bacterium]